MRHPLDWLLRLAVPKDDCPAVLGDLSEEYEHRVRPERRWLGAHAWYVGQLCAAVGFALIGRLRRFSRSLATFRLESEWQDLRYAGRLARRQPVFTISAIVTLTLGIAGAAATFTIFDRVLLQPLPYPEPDRIVALTNAVWPHFGPTGVSLSKEATAVPQFTALGMFQPAGLNLGDADHPERLPAAAVDSGFFRTLGVQPLIGRFFTSDDDRRQPVAVMAFDTWRAVFNADRSLVGRDIRLNGRPYRVVGIMPRGFTFPNNTAVWVPPGVDAQMTGVAYMPTVIGRLASGASTGEAMAALARAQDVSGRRAGTPPGTATPLHDDLVKGPRPTLIVLVGLSALLLLSASANVAGLLAVRLRGRRREFVMRATLGATRGRLVRQILTESLALVTISSIGGATLALWAVRLFAWSMPTFAPNVDRPSATPPAPAWPRGAAGR